MSRLRPLGGAAVLVVAVLLAGPAAVPDALRSVDLGALATGAALAVVTTTCAALRWQVVARRLGVGLSLPAAVAGCYRAQFLNGTLPGGVLGDVARGVHHGRDVGDVGRALRVVVWERSSGQLVAVLATLLGLTAGTTWTPRPAVGWWGPAAVVACGGVPLVVSRRLRTLPVRAARTLAADARALLAPGTAVAIVAASAMVLAGHVATFVLAARVVGARLELRDLVPVALVVLLVGAVPLNLAGWGPREGAAAWAFASVGAGASQGVAVAVAYGTIAFVATLPGAALLAAGRFRRPGPATPSAPSAADAEGGIARG